MDYYLQGTLLDIFIILFLSIEIKTHRNEEKCDCIGIEGHGIMCNGLQTGGSLFRVCNPNPSSSPARKLIIRDSNTLSHLDLSRDFEGVLVTELLTEIRIVNNSHLQKIRLCDTKRLPCRASFPMLQTLDLRDNYVSDIIYPTSLFELPSLRKVFLSGNPWACFSKSNNQSSHKLSWLLSNFRHSLVRDEPTCSKPKSDKWHQYHARSRIHSSNVTLIYFLEFYKTLQDRCPTGCTCLIININKPLLVKVSCVGLNLTRLPDKLPPNTSDLDVSFNKLENINELRTNHNYRSLSKLRAVRNKIISLSDLQGSPFMRNRPTTINVQNNSITHFDVDLLEPLLSDMRKKNFHGSVDFLFFGNPLDCNCRNLTKLQQFLYEYKLYLRDADLLACGINQSPILIQIDYAQFCETSFDYMWIVIFGESFLLILVLSRLTYDVINYRRSGELPWLAKNMYLGCSYVGFRKSTFLSFLRNSECQSHCTRVKRGEELVSVQRLEVTSDRVNLNGTSKNCGTTHFLKNAFRSRRLPLTLSSPLRGNDDDEMKDNCI
eukprot:TRINITY_DN3263_c0_g2_i3.p1 TRINITY_DN3263_c0_g2~~TRINITY_DN3263_c0_g2_i3.p1  ORF type:complete len:547 (+),score=-2.82 TRINITY_DN3263_c0_g2_i3:260-1900(+)